MTKSQKQWWEQERAKGYNQYLLRRGLRVGLLCASSLTLFEILGSFFWHEALGSVWPMLATFGCVTVACGYVMARSNWRDNEAAFKEPTEPDDAPHDAGNATKDTP